MFDKICSFVCGDMVGRGSDVFSNKVLHFGASLHGTRLFWLKQKSRLIAMIDTLGLPTVFFTHSAADLQWPELLGVESPNTSTSRSNAVIENPCLADWFFYHRIIKFMDVFYVGILKAKDYWLRFEYQHEGSPHVHGVAWLEGAPDVLSSRLLLSRGSDRTVTTVNPAVLSDGSNVSDAPLPKTDPHVCNKSYLEVEDHHQDYMDLIATCQRHTRCSAAYCLKTRNGSQECRFGYPKDLQPETVVVTKEDQEPELITTMD